MKKNLPKRIETKNVTLRGDSKRRRMKRRVWRRWRGRSRWRRRRRGIWRRWKGRSRWWRRRRRRRSRRSRRGPTPLDFGV